MTRIGATMIVMGLSQLCYQVWLWLETGVWHALSFTTMLRQLGLGEVSLGWGALRTTAEAALSVEAGAVLVLLGICLVLVRPVSMILHEIGLQRRLAQTRREIRSRRESAA